MSFATPRFRVLSSSSGDEAASRTFSHALTDLLVEQHKPIPEDLLKEKDSTVELALAEVQAALEDYNEGLSDAANP